MSYLIFAVWFSLLFHDLQLFGVRGAYGQWVVLPSPETFTILDELPIYPKNIVKRDTAAQESPLIFQFELSDAKEPDEDTKKLIEKRSRELRSNLQTEDVVNITASERRKRSTQKTKPQLIPFLVSDAKEPDSATKELIRQSRAKELSKLPRAKQSSSKKSTKAPVTKAPTKTSKPLRQSRIRKLPSVTQTRQRPTKKSSKSRRTRRYAQFTEPRYIKFDLNDAKDPNAEPESSSYDQQNQTQDYFDSSTGESRQQYYFHRSPMKSQFVSYPKRFSQNDVVLKVRKLQKYIANGQGLENINTNIEITIPPTVTAAAVVENLIDYPEPVYGKKLCAYAGANQICGMNLMSPQFRKIPPRPAHNFVYKPQVSNIQQQYQHVNTLPQADSYPNQQLVAHVKPFQVLQPIVHVTPQPQQQHQELQVSQNLVEDQTLNKDQTLNIAYIQPAYVYGDKLYPYAAQNQQHQQHQQPQPIAEQTNAVPLDPEEGLKNQGNFLSSIVNNIENQDRINSLKENKEFQDLSALIGKSPEDQVHGLSYLLAKEMQRQKRFKPQRPQDQTSPIVFHPENSQNDNNQIAQQQSNDAAKVEMNQEMATRQNRQLFKIYPENVELNTPSSHVNPPPSLQVNQVEAISSSSEAKAIGLSPNYNGIDANVEKDYSQDESESVSQYASKYAFGYRVRDFDTGNDFSHKQNRDVNGVTHGQYHILMPDGRIQNVIYYADDTGFHADVSY